MLLQNQALLTATESRLAEDKKQYDLMLENKQLELSRHLKELSQKNDQVQSLTIYLNMYFKRLYKNFQFNSTRILIRQLMTSGRSMRWRSWRLLIWKRRRFAYLLYIAIYLATKLVNHLFAPSGRKSHQGRGDKM